MYRKKNDYRIDMGQWGINSPSFQGGGYGGVDDEINKLQGQIGNYNTRLGAMGIDGAKEADNRNWFEKLTNLTPNQNFVKDFFELLNRPQEAITGMFQELTRNDDIPVDTSGMGLQDINNFREEQARNRNMSAGERALQGLKQGFSGEKNYYYGQVLRNLFQDGKQEDGKFDWTDGLGLFLDMTLDPMTLAVGGLNKAGVVGKVADAGADVNKLAQGADALDTTSDVIKGADVLSDASKSVDVANDIATRVAKSNKWKQGVPSGVPEFLTDFQKSLTKIEEGGNLSRFADTWANTGAWGKTKLTAGAILDPINKATDINRYLFSADWNATHRTLNEAVFSGLFDLGKKGTKVVGNMAESGFNKYIENLAEVNPKKAKELSDRANNLTEDFKHLLSKPTKNAKHTNFLAQQDLNDLAVEMKDVNENLFYKIHDNMDDFKRMGFADESEVSRAIYQMIEAQAEDQTMTLMEFLNNRQYGYGVAENLPNTPELVESLENMFPGKTLNELGISEISDGKALHFDKKMWGKYGRGEIEALADEEAYKNLLTHLGKAETYEEAEPLINLGSNLKRTDEFKKYQDIYDNNELFKDAVDSYHYGFSEIQERVNDKFFGDKGTLRTGTPKGYLPRTITDDTVDFLKAFNPEGEPILGFEPDFDKWTDANKAYAPHASDGNVHAYKELKGRKITGLTTHDAENVIMADYLDNFKNKEWVAEQVERIGQENFDKAKDIITAPGFEWYAQDAYKSVMDFATNKTQAISDTKKKTQILMDATFNKEKNTYKALEFVDPGLKAPRKGYVSLSEKEVNTLLRDFERMDEWSGGDKAIKTMIDSLEKAANGKSHAFLSEDIAPFVTQISGRTGDTILQEIENFNNMFKSGKVMSPSFHANNIVGNASNQIITGMTGGEVAQYHAHANSFKNQIGDVGSGGLLDKQLSGAKLTKAEKTMLEDYKVLRDAGIFTPEYTYDLHGVIDDKLIGLDDTAKKLDVGKDSLTPNSLKGTGYDIPEHRKGGKIKEGYRKVGELNMKANQYEDDLFRISTYLYAKDNPQYLTKLGLDNPIDAVKLVHYDPTDLTLLEDKYLKKVIPFYTFARMNAGLQVKNLFKNPDRLRDMNRFNKSLWGGLGVDPEDRRPFERESHYLPSIGTMLRGVNKDEEDEDGNYGGYTSLKASPGYTEFPDMMTNPLGWLVSSSTPLLRVPFEKATGVQAFTGKPISNYKGEKSTKFPWLTKDQEYMFSQTGFDVPARSLQGLFEMLSGDISGGSKKALNYMQDGSVEQAHKAQAYDELSMYEELVKRLKAQGKPVPTLAELKKMGIIPK